MAAAVGVWLLIKLKASPSALCVLLLARLLYPGATVGGHYAPTRRVGLDYRDLEGTLKATGKTGSTHKPAHTRVYIRVRCPDPVVPTGLWPLPSLMYPSLAMFCAMHEQELGGVMHRFDKDGDGTVDVVEFTKAFFKMGFDERTKRTKERRDTEAVSGG